MHDFDRLLEPEIPRLRRYARALTRDVVRADDLVQNCLERALDKQHLWQPGTNLRAWLFTILHNLNVNDVRRIVNEGIPIDVEEVTSDLISLPRIWGVLSVHDVEVALAQLPVDQRHAIVLVVIEGLGYKEVATTLGIPLGTLRSRLSRGRVALRKLVNGDEVISHAASKKSVSDILDRILTTLEAGDTGNCNGFAVGHLPVLIPHPTRAILVKEITHPGKNSQTKIFRVIEA